MKKIIKVKGTSKRKAHTRKVITKPKKINKQKKQAFELYQAGESDYEGYSYNPTKQLHYFRLQRKRQSRNKPTRVQTYKGNSGM